jgi:hypothetical protein
MTKRLTEKDLNNLKIKLNSNKSTSILSSKISLTNEKPIKTKTPNINTNDIIKSNKSAIIQTTVSDTHFSIIFDGAKLLSINQIFAILQYRKYEMFAYKKSWHEIIQNILFEKHTELTKQGLSLPYFNDSVELTIFRQAPRLVDEDALTTMFKYIIDALKLDKNKNPYGILADDNPKIVHKIESYSEKGPYCLGIKIKLIECEKKQNYTLNQILIK